MPTAALVAQLALTYGPPAIDAVAKLVATWGKTEAVPLEEWQALRAELAGLPDYWSVVNQPVG